MKPFCSAKKSALALAILLVCLAVNAAETFLPGELWPDNRGQPINAHGGGMLFHEGAYPAGHLGEPTGEADASSVQFRASKRKLQWLALTDNAGQGVALLQVAGTPLTGRGRSRAADGATLFASRELAGPQDYSGSWVSSHDIRASKSQPLSGAFILRAIAP